MTTISLFVSSSNSQVSCDRRFLNDLTVSALKGKLELIVGTPSAFQELQLKSEEGDLIATLSDDTKPISAYNVADGMKLYVVDKDPSNSAAQFSDVSQVEKVEMEDADYDKREDSVRAFKRKMKLGRFGNGESGDSETVLAADQDLVAKMKVGDRCRIQGPTRLGCVMFIGETKFKPGCVWVGVKLDLPLGKNNGSVNGVEYFQCEDKYGVFLRPKLVTVGDFPEEELEDEEI